MSSSVLPRTSPSNCEGVAVGGEVSPEGTKILSQDALTFLAALHRRFETRRRELLVRRIETQGKLDAGKMPGFLDETREIRESDWTVAKLPPDLVDRRVEQAPIDCRPVE